MTGIDHLGQRERYTHDAAGRMTTKTVTLSLVGGEAVGSPIRYNERLAEASVDPSVGNNGNSYDNVLAGTINGLYKAPPSALEDTLGSRTGQTGVSVLV